MDNSQLPPTPGNWLLGYDSATNGGILPRFWPDPMDDSFRLKVTFWGVRGSIPTPEADHLKYGGNTACVEVRMPGGEIFILDGGTGIRALGSALETEFKDQNLALSVFLTHFHWDHIQGIPFFDPLYSTGNRIDFYAVEPKNSISYRRHEAESRLEEILKLQMESPYFPIRFDELSAAKQFHEIQTKPLQFGNLEIRPFPLNHPGGACGYRLESAEAVMVYATDLEHGDKNLDKLLRELSEGADLLIFDSHFTPEDYKRHPGWGHSTWVEACAVARDAKVKQLALFHHNPFYNDEVFDGIVEQSRRKFEHTIGAAEGTSVIL